MNNEGVVLFVFEMYKSIDFQASVDTFSEAPILDFTVEMLDIEKAH